MPTQMEATASPDLSKTDPPEPADIATNKYTVWVVTATILLCAFAWSFFSELNNSIDTIGLYSSVYTYLHYGKMTSPAYHFFHAMIIHPPTRYLAVALLMKAGIPFQYAMCVPAFLLMSVAILVIATSRFSSSAKIFLLCGMLMGTLQVGPMELRPDLDVGLAWFAGLVTLEAGRLQNWDSKRLFLGAFLLTAASGIHYTASVAWLGAVVYIYAGWCLADSKWKTVLSIIAGGCLFGIPYLALFVIPHWVEINSWIHATQATAGILASVRNHYHAYKLLYADCTNIPCRIVFWPLGAGLPVVIIAFPVLFCIRQVRGLALASLPQVLFFLLFAQRKPTMPGYFLPELILYSCAISFLCIWTIRRLEEHFRKPARLALPIASVVLLSAVLSAAPWLKYTYLRVRPDELGIARAAGRRILGPNALVGVRFAGYYTNGGTYLYLIEPELLWHNLGNLNLKSYFDNFDALAEDAFMSDATVNEQNKSLTSWYADGVLQLRGFYFSGSQEDLFHLFGFQNNLRSYLLLSARKPSTLQGFVLLPDGRQVAEYREEADGKDVFVAAVCDSRPNLNLPGLEYPDFFLLPSEDHNPLQKGLLTFVTESQAFLRLQPLLAGTCTFHEKRVMKKNLISTQTFLAALKGDQDIHFYDILGDATDARYGPEARIEFGADLWPSSITFLHGAQKGESYSFIGAGARQLFRSDMDSTDGWWASPQKKVYGLEIVASDLRAGERSGDYKTDKAGGYIVSNYEPVPADGSALYFFTWVKTIRPGDPPKLTLQNETYNSMAVAHALAQRNDGWTLLGGWIPRTSAQQVRLLIEQDKNMESLIDKTFIVAVSAGDRNRSIEMKTERMIH
jgi:hypothetical protein